MYTSLLSRNQGGLVAKYKGRPRSGVDDFTIEERIKVVDTLENCSFPGCPQKILAPKDTPEENRQCSSICWVKAKEQINRAEAEKARLGIHQ